MLAEIAGGVLVDVIVATGRWLAASAMSGTGGGKRARRDAEVAVWFGTYELVANAPPLPPGVPEDAAGVWLRGNDVHALLHELLATRITDAPETDVARLRTAFRRTAHTALDPRPRGPGRPGRPPAPPPEAADPPPAVEPPAPVAPGADGDRSGAAGAEPSGPGMGGLEVAGSAADAVFDWADGEICELVARFEARDPQRWRAARTDAFGARVVAVLNAIDRHLTALDGGADPEADAAWAARYRAQALRAHGGIEPPDFARRRRVPIDDLYVPPRIVEPGGARDADGAPRTIAFSELVRRLDRTVLLGDPGGGKSTAAQVITHRWAADPAARVPFLVVLRDFAGGDGPGRSVVEHIEDRLNAFHQCPAPGGTVERLLLAGNAAVIFDGLDELIDTGRRVEVTRVVEQFCERYPLAPVLVTSRLVGYDEARLDDAQFDRYRIAGFTRDETAAYVRNWFAQEDDVGAEEAGALAEAFLRESEQVADLRANPLMLALMCILYRGEGFLPRNRPAVYAECARLLFDKWDTRRRIHVDLRVRNLIEPALRHIAYWLFTRDGAPQVTEGELVAEAAGFLLGRGFERRHDAEEAAAEFVAFCRGRAWILGDAGTTARGATLYTFTHRTFLEYFAAAHLAAAHDTPQSLARTLAPYVARGEWDVVGQLAVQIKDASADRGAERVLTALLGDRRRRSPEARAHLAAFAARCLDVAEVPPALVREVTDRAFDRLTPGDASAIAHLPLRRDDVRETITGVIHGRVAALVGSADPGERALGLHSAAYATFLAADAADIPHWHRLERALTAAHRDALAEEARTDDAIWMRLVDRGVITLATALRLRGFDLGVLLRSIPVPFTGRRWPPYVAQALGDVGGRDPYLAADPDAAVDRCRAFGEALPELPAPPWPIPDDASGEMGSLGSLLDGVVPAAGADPVAAAGARALRALLADRRAASYSGGHDAAG